MNQITEHQNSSNTQKVAPAGKTVLFFVNSLPHFIAHRSNLLQPFLERGIKIILLTGGVTAESSDALPDGVILVPIALERHALSPLSDFSAMTNFAKTIRKYHPDVVHSFTIKPNLFSGICLRLLKLFGFKVPRLIVTFPGLGRVFEGYSYRARIRRRLVATTLANTLRKLDYFATFENEADRADMIDSKILLAERAHALLGAGINLTQYYPPKHTREGNLTFLCASRLLNSKGIPEYVAACNVLAKEGVKAEFLLAGPGDPGYPGNYDVNAAVASGSLGVVKYLGAVPYEGMPQLLRGCDVVCSPSRLREGFPRVLIEAAACGVALISSDQPSVRPIVQQSKTGWLIDMDDPKALVNAMRQAAENASQTREKGQSALNLLHSLPTSDMEIAEQFLTLYFFEGQGSR